MYALKVYKASAKSGNIPALGGFNLNIAVDKPHVVIGIFHSVDLVENIFTSLMGVLFSKHGYNELSPMVASDLPKISFQMGAFLDEMDRVLIKEACLAKSDLEYYKLQLESSPVYSRNYQFTFINDDNVSGTGPSTGFGVALVVLEMN